MKKMKSIKPSEFWSFRTIKKKNNFIPGAEKSYLSALKCFLSHYSCLVANLMSLLYHSSKKISFIIIFSFIIILETVLK